MFCVCVCVSLSLSLLGDQGARSRVILVFRECIWNAATVSLGLPDFDDTGSVSSLPRRVVYLPVSTLGDCFPITCRK